VKITMTAEISGLRDGNPWPARGGSIEVPDDEAEGLIANGLAKKYEKADKAQAPEVVGASTELLEVTEPPVPETATTPAPARKAPAKRAAKKAPAKAQD
jgi:hypothetical protein